MRHLTFALLLTALSATGLQAETIHYTADHATLFANPERGWYAQFNGYIAKPPKEYCRPHDPINLEFLQQLRHSPERMTVYRDWISIPQFTGAPIPKSRFDEIRRDFATARKAGFKVIVRLTYWVGMGNEDPPEEIVSRHLDQLAPLLKENMDVILSMEGGILGGCGEGATSQHYLGGSNGLNDAGIRIYTKVLDLLPPSRQLNVRYPKFKYALMGWSDPEEAVPLDESTGFAGGKASRIGFYDDNFAGDINHWGFFNAYGERDRAFVEADSRYTMVQGELSGRTDYNTNNGYVEMKKYHFTAFHAIYSLFGRTVGPDNGHHYWDSVADVWKSTGQYEKMGRELGYRFRLLQADVPSSTPTDAVFKMTMNMANDGFARIINPRNVELVFRNVQTGKKHVILVDGDGRGNRLWLPGPGETKTLKISEQMPEGIRPGDYELLLHLADPYPSIHDRPEYSIRLANQGLWEAETGYNKLNAIVTVETPAVESLVHGVDSVHGDDRQPAPRDVGGSN